MIKLIRSMPQNSLRILKTVNLRQRRNLNRIYIMETGRQKRARFQILNMGRMKERKSRRKSTGKSAQKLRVARILTT